MPIVLQKSFCIGDQKFSGPYTRLSCKDVGTSSPDDELTGDLGNVIDATKIAGRRLVRLVAGNLSPGNFGLLQHNLPIAS